MNSIFVTGINGFIGSAYARLARSRGLNVIGSDLGAEDMSGTSSTYFSADLSVIKSADLIAAVPRVDYILHAGGVSGFMVAQDNPERIVATNVSGTGAVLELARVRRPQRVVLCSTIMAYGPDEGDLALRCESEYPKPVSVYGASKVAVEAMMHGFHGQCGIDAVALRFSHVYGPGRTTECFVREMLQSAAAEEVCCLPQSSRSRRQYVHIDDVCCGIDLAMEIVLPASRVFNISAGEIHTLSEVAVAVRAVVGPLKVSFAESGDISAYKIGLLSIERARRELGYSPQFPLLDGLRRYWKSSFARR